MATPFSILAWRIPWAEQPGGLHTVHRVAKSWTRLNWTGNFKGKVSSFLFLYHNFYSNLNYFAIAKKDFPVAQMVKNLHAVQDTWVRSLVWEDSLEKGMAVHSSILAWRIPWTEEPGGLWSMGSQRVGHHWGGKVTTNLDSILKSRDITLPTKVHLVKAMFFTVVMYECESWTIKKAESQRIDVFELWCWRRLLSPLDSKESSQS